MRLRVNLFANFAGSAVAGVAAVVVAPLIYRWLGAEAYGLIGIYLIGQTLLLLIDAGLIPAFARAVAWYRGQDGALGKVVNLLRSFERPLWMAAAMLAVAGWFVSDWLARRWLLPQSLSHETVVVSIRLAVAALALRLVAGLYRVGMLALERQVQANAVHILANLMRTFGALALAVILGLGIVGFFVVQIVTSIGECVVYRWRLRAELPLTPVALQAGELRGHIRFAFGAAGPIILSVATSQADKLAMSRTLSLLDYGVYSLTVHLASAVVLVAMAVQQAVMPRMTRLFAQGGLESMRELYGLATAAIVSLGCALVAALSFAGDGLIVMLDKGEHDVAGFGLVAAWYGVGNLAVALASLAYVLQFAHGRLRLYIAGTGLLALTQIPLVVSVAQTGNAMATAIAYAGVSLAYLALWLPLVHAKFLPGGHVRWLLDDLLRPLLAGTLVALVTSYLMPRIEVGLVLLAQAAIVGMLTALAALIAHKELRTQLLHILQFKVVR